MNEGAYGEDRTTTARLEAAFELSNSRVKWTLDPHEEQNAEQRVALQRLLGL